MLITNGIVWTMEGEVYQPGYVQIKDAEIAAVGPMEQIEDCLRDEREEVLDVSGAWVLPGIIEAHCHIGITEDKHGIIGDDCNEMTEPVTPHLRALDAIDPMDGAFHEAIMAGITSVMITPGSANVVGGQSVFLKTQGRCIDAMVMKAPAAMKVAFGENPKTNYGENGKMPATRMAIAGMLREELQRAVLYKKQKESGRDILQDIRMEAWLPVLRREIPLKAHVHRADDILTAIRIAKEFHLRMTLDHCTEGHLIAEEIRDAGYPAIVGPGLAARSKIEVQNMSFKTNRILHEAGVLHAITTDHPVSLIRYLPLCAGLAVKQGLSREAALAAITINPAKICGVEDRVGSLRAGKDADLAIFSADPLELSTETLYTIINGEIVYQREDTMEKSRSSAAS